MKYIRTKNGIFDTTTMSVASLYDNGVLVENVSYTKKIDDFTLLHIYAKDILKQADTIEELCDEIVQVLENGYHNQCPTTNYYKDMLKQKEVLFPTEMGADYYVKVVAVYGAIWTEWGLKYVAKMNDKGELKLL